jgi:serine/threonine protein phosphatase PrpC
MFVANAGDSRAVMACSDGQGNLVAKNLTRDHKPDDPEEQERIEKWGGYVCPPYEEGLSARVYLDPHFTMIGLAMSRSIGKCLLSMIYLFCSY